MKRIGMRHFYCCALVVMLVISTRHSFSFAGEGGLPPVPLSEKMSELKIDSSLGYYEDTTRKLTVHDIAGPAYADRFTPSLQGHDPTARVTAWWLRFSAHNPADVPVTWFYRDEIPHANIFELYEPDGKGDYRLHKGGMAYPFREHDVAYFKEMFRVTTPPHAATTFYVRIEMANGDGCGWLPSLWTEDEFTLKSVKELFLYGLFYGVMAALILYNLFLYFLLKDRAYLWYVLNALSMTAIWVADNGFGHAYLWDESAYWGRNAVLFAVIAMFASASQFTRRFFNTDSTGGKVDWILKGVIAFQAVSLVVVAVESPWGIKLISVNLLAITLFWGIAFHFYRKGVNPAKYYLLAWTTSIAGGVSVGLAINGLMPIDLYLETLVLAQAGAAADVVLFSFALADRINILRKEKEDGQERWLASEKAHSAELEMKVNARTAELKAVNALKDKFVGLVSHDLRGSLASLRGNSSLLHSGMLGPLNPDQFKTATHIIECCDSLLSFIENILDISRLQSGAIVPERRHCVAKQLVLYVALRLDGKMVEKGISLAMNIPPDAEIYADPELAGQAVQNLLANAVKFSRAGGTITVFQPDGKSGVIAFRDTGTGIKPVLIDDLFRHEVKTSTPGTGGERGTGMGLPLCKDIMDSHGGKIWVESAEGKGSTFFLEFPPPDAFEADTVPA